MAMSAVYNGKHGICTWKKIYRNGIYSIENPKFTWEDFHLIPVSRPSLSIPKANYTISQIPNSSKRLNITDYLTGGLTYESRTGEWEFYIDHDLWSEWTEAHYEIEEYYNGSKVLLSLDDDRSDIYEGRVYLSTYKPGDDYSTVTISYDLDVDPINDYTDVYFRVRFIGMYGEVLQNDILAYNDIPYFSGALRPDDHLQFSHWNPAIDKVTRNIDYIAEYR